jgi:folate-binding protein YgfZ
MVEEVSRERKDLQVSIMPRSALFAKLETAGAQSRGFHGWEIAASFGSVEAEYWTLKKGAGLFDLSHRGRLLVRGKDAPRFLHGMVTNDVKGIEAGRGNYSFFLDVHGHILSEARVLRLEAESFLLDCEPQSYEVIQHALQSHIIADRVKLEDQRETSACLGIEGPAARQALQRAIAIDLPEMKPLDHVYLEEIGVRVVRGTPPSKEGYSVLSSPDRAAEVWEKIANAGTDLGVKPVGFEALEVFRIERGVPRYGVDITDKNLVQETGQMQAVSFTKGCYIGQEVVERIRSRGHVNRKLVQLLFEGRQDVAPETATSVDGQAVGITGSSAYSFELQKTIAFGYVRMEHAQAGKRVMVGAVAAEVGELPTSRAVSSSGAGIQAV